MPNYWVVNKSLAKKFGKVIRQAREELEISEEFLALEIDMDRSFVGRLERGTRLPTIDTLFRLAKGLKLPASELIRRLE